MTIYSIRSHHGAPIQAFAKAVKLHRNKISVKMDSTILERTGYSLGEDYHNIGEARHSIYGDADLLENDPVVRLVLVSYMRTRTLETIESRRPREFKVRVVT